MIRSTLLLVVFVAIATAGLNALFQATYPFVLASKEARSSLEVTQAQFDELNNATQLSDVIALSIFGAVYAAGFAVLIGKSTTMMNRLKGGAAGLVLGAAAGALAGFIGHWLRRNLPIEDPMVHQAIRWSAMLAPIAIACSLAVGLSGSFKKDFVRSVPTGLLGAVVAAVAFALLSGSVTIAEPKHIVFPHHMSNRFLTLIASGLCIGLGVITGLNAKEKASDTQPQL